jgi:hypothetical protein
MLAHGFERKYRYCDHVSSLQPGGGRETFVSPP